MAVGTVPGSPMPAPALVRPQHGPSSQAYRRKLISLAAGIALAACVCAVLVRSNSSFHEEDKLVLAKRMELAQSMVGTLPPELSFGDSAFHASAAPASVREGSIRNGVVPSKPNAPKSIADVGLEVPPSTSARAQQLTLKPTGAQLSFGDAGFHLSAETPSGREGGVRSGKKPDFKPPLGSLGESGLKDPLAPLSFAAGSSLAASPSSSASSSSASSALAFGDSSFMRELERPEDREGSVRKGVKPDFQKPLGDLGDVGLRPAAPVHAETLASSKKAAAPPKEAAPKKGSVQEHEDAAEEEVDKRLAALAFGDASFHTPAQAASGREGSVRGGKKPDFAPPLGDLGEVGLKAPKTKELKPVAAKAAQALVAEPAGARATAAKPTAATAEEEAPKQQEQQQQLAFGDAAFHAGTDQAGREGSVRGGKKPDFAPPLGDLGKTGLVAAAAPQKKAGGEEEGGRRESARAERAADERFFDGEEAAAAPASKPELSAKAARNEVSDYFGKLAAKAAQSNTQQERAEAAAQAMAAEAEASYEAALQHQDKHFEALREKQLREQAVQTRHAQHAAAQARAATVQQAAKAEGGDKALVAAEVKTALGGGQTMFPDAMVRASGDQGNVEGGLNFARSFEGGSKAGSRAARGPVKKAKLEELAGEGYGGEQTHLSYDKDAGNKHGFHPGSMAKSASIKKELEAARTIEKSDLDDCTFTLC